MQRLLHCVARRQPVVERGAGELHRAGSGGGGISALAPSVPLAERFGADGCWKILGSSTPRNEAMSPRLTSLSIAEGRALAAATEHAEVEVVVRPSDVLCKRGRPSALQRDPACALRLARALFHMSLLLPPRRFASNDTERLVLYVHLHKAGGSTACSVLESCGSLRHGNVEMRNCKCWPTDESLIANGTEVVRSMRLRQLDMCAVERAYQWPAAHVWRQIESGA